MARAGNRRGHDHTARVRHGGRLWHLDSAGPAPARCAAALPDLLRGRRQPRRRRDRPPGRRWPPGAGLAGLLAAAGRRRGMDGGQLLRLQGRRDDRARPGRRNLDAAQHHRRVRLGSPALRRAGPFLRHPLRRPGRRPARRAGRGTPDRQLPGQPRRPAPPAIRTGSCGGRRARQDSCGEVTSFQHSGPQYPRR